MIRLENLLNSRKEIFIDSCLISPKEDRNFHRSYDQTIQVKIDAESLKKECEILTHGINLLSCRNVFVIKEIENELFCYKTFTSSIIERIEKDDQKIRYLNEIKEKLNILPTLLESSRINVEGDLFNSLNYMFRIIENSLDPKKDPLNCCGRIKYESASYGDIGLVSAFYLRRILGQPAVIFTSDRDIRKLIGVSANIFLEKYFDDIDIFQGIIKDWDPIIYTPNKKDRYSIYEERWNTLMNFQRMNKIPTEKRPVLYKELKKEMRKIRKMMSNPTI